MLFLFHKFIFCLTTDMVYPQCESDPLTLKLMTPHHPPPMGDGGGKAN